MLALAPLIQAQQATVTYAMQGYSVKKTDAAALLSALPQRISSKDFVAQVSSLTNQGKAQIIKMPVVSLPSGQRGKGTEGEFGLELDATVGADGKTMDVVLALGSGKVLRIQTAVPLYVDVPAFVGSFEESDEEKVTMVFMRASFK